jgi:hypothetical protein
VRSACLILGQIPNESHQRIHVLLELQVAPRVVALLNGSTTFHRAALRLLGNLLTGSDLQTQKLLDLQVFSIRVSVLFQNYAIIETRFCRRFMSSNISSLQVKIVKPSQQQVGLFQMSRQDRLCIFNVLWKLVRCKLKSTY